MKKTNKIVSLVLALVMILSIMPYGVFAEEDNGVENNPVVGIEPQAPPSDEEVEETTVAVPSEPTEIEPKAENRTEATPEKELAAAKTNAKAEIDAAAKAKKEAINGVDGAKQTEIDTALKAVNEAVTSANNSIDTATTIEDVKTAKTNGINAINAIELPKADLDTVKNKAKDEIDTAAKAKKEAINGVDGAKQTEIDTALKAVNEAVTSANNSIDTATTIEDVKTAKTNGINAIDEIKLPEADLDTVKNNAKAEIDAAAIAKKDAIDKLTNVSSSEKTKAKNSVNELAKNGKTTIDAQDTIAKVNTEKTKIINAINAVTPTIIKLEITNVYRSGNYIKGKVNVPYATVYFYREDGSSAYASDEADKDGYFEIYVRNVYRYDYLLAKLSGYTNSEEYTFGRNWSDWDDDDYYREREIYPTNIRVSNDGYKVSGYTNYRNTRVYAYYDGRTVGNGYTDSDGYFNFSTDRKIYNDSDLRFYIGSRATDSIDKEIYPTSIRVSNDGYRVTGYTNYKNTRVYVYYDGKSVGNGYTDSDGYFSISTDRKIYNDKYLRFYTGDKTVTNKDKEIYPTSIRVSNDGYRVTGYTNYKNTRVYVYYDGSSVGNGTTDRDGYFSISTDRKIYNDKYLRFYIAGTSTDDEKLEQLSRIAYIKGYPDGTFKPNSNMTRAEAVTMFARLIKGSENYGTSKQTNFSDSNNKWFSEALNFVAGKNLIKGYPDGTFRPNEAITRAEFAQMISGYLTDNKSSRPFADTEDHWAKDAIAILNGNKVVKGYPNGTFKPNAEITRAEAVTILNSAFGRISENSSFVHLQSQLKSFSDINSNAWYYADVMDASNAHDSYRLNKDEVETWTKVK